MQQPKKWYDDFYTRQPADFLNHVPRHTLTASLCHGSVADIGACMGILSEYYHGDYTGFDFSEVALAKGREARRKDARLVFHDCSDLSGIEIEKFDSFVLAEFLEHFENDDKILDPIFERAKPGTRIIVSVPNGDRIPDDSHAVTFTIPELRKKFAPYGKVKFYNWSGAERHIIMSCDLGQKNDNLLSLAIIAKNEGLGLENAILSCIEHVDNVSISVDEASDDNTLDVARRYADFLKTHEWENDFAKARNHLQTCINTDWVLWLDGHEYVSNFFDLSKALIKPYDGYFVKIHLENNFEFFFARLLRKEVQWEYAVHNNPCVKNSRRIDSFVITHDRSNSQSKEGAALRDAQRDKMVTTLFLAEIKKDRKNSRPYFYLAQHASYCKNLNQAIRFYKKCFKYSKKKDERWLCWWEIASIYSYKDQYTRALLAFQKADKEMPGRWEISWSLGLMWALTGNTDLSLNYFVQALEPQKESYMYSPLKFDEALIFDCIGAGLYSKNKPEEAKIAWRRSLEVELKKPPAVQDKKRIEIQKRMLA